MDQKLLDALSNLSQALEQISESLKGGKGNKSATTDALQSGNFISQLKEINVGIKQLQIDSKKILKNQETIIQLSKKSSADKKSEIESAGGDKKKESDIKRGVGTILLIAVAVLAIGMAFKLVGGINFFAVVGLSIGIFLVAKAFEKVASLKMSLKEAAVVSASLVLMAMGITFSSWIMAKITPISITQSLTAILIGVGFSAMAPAIGKIINSFSGMSWGGVIKASVGLVLVLPAIALGITLSSWILRRLTPISFGQALSAIFIAGMFTVVSFGIKKLIGAFGGNNIGAIAKSVIFLPLVLPAIALGIVLSSYVLQKTQPVGLSQAFSAIMIALIFTVISFGLKNIVNAMGSVSVKSALMVPLILPLIAVAIAVSSKAFGMVQPISFVQFLTAIGIALVFVVIGFALKLMDKAMSGMSWSTLVKIPVLFTLVSLAIMLSSHILSKTRAPSLSETLEIGFFGIALAFIIAAMMIPFVIISKFKIGTTDILKGTLAIIAIAGAIMVSSHIIGMGKYTRYPSLAWSVGAGAAILTFGLAVLGLGAAIMITGGLGLAAIAMGALSVVMVAASIAESSHILARGKYDKYPSLGWSLSVGGLMIAFSAVMVVLGIMPKVVIKDGVHAIKEVAKSIVTTDKEVRKGKYDFYPGIGWSVTVSALMIGYAIGLAALGILPKIVVKDGVHALKEVAKSIVTTDKEVRKGKYDFYPGIGWSVTVSALMLGYAVGLTALGILPKVIVRDGIWALKEVAKSIATTDKEVRKGKYEKYPGIGWSLTVSALMLGYAAGMTVLGILPKAVVRDGIWALRKVAKSILTTDREIRKGKYTNYPGLEWTGNVGLLMAAWGTGMTVLGILPKFVVRDGVWAVEKIARSIVSTGRIFTENIGVFKDGPKKEWAEGVSMAIGAFGEVYSLVLKSGAINAIFGGNIKPDDFGVAITTISSGIVEAARFFGNPKLSGIWKPGPTKAWAEGIGLAIGAFSPVYAMLLQNAPGFLSKGGGVGPKEFSKAVVTVSHGIIAAASIFDVNSAKFEEGKYPSVQWGKGVGAALKAFAPVFKALHEDVGMFTSGDEVINNMIRGIVSIAGAIVKVAKKFSGTEGSWTSYPDSKWAEGVKKSVMSYVETSNSVDNMLDFTAMHTMDSLVDRLIRTARVMGKNSSYFNTKINPDFMKSISSNLFYYMSVVKRLQSKQGGMTGLLKSAIMGDPILNMAKGMVALAAAYDKLASSLTKMGKAMESLNDKKISQMERMSKIKIPKKDSGSIGIGSMDAGGSAVRMAGSPGTDALNMVTPNSASSKRSAVGVDKQGWTKGKNGNIAAQNDMIIDLLQKLNVNILQTVGDKSTLSTYLKKHMNSGDSSLDG